MLKECYIRTASLVPLYPQYEQMTKTARYIGKSIYRIFCLIKLCLYTRVACLVKIVLKATEFEITKENKGSTLAFIPCC